MDKSYTEINARGVDQWVENDWEWGRPIAHDVFARAKEKGEWDVLLTPQIPVPHAWFAPCLTNDRLDGTSLLGLASGGGQQMPIFAALGARGTVLDYSQRQLDSEKMVAEREGYAIDIVRADMTKRLPFADRSFDLIFHPVSNCYIEDVYHVWNECFRVLRPGGVLLAGMDNGLNFLVDQDEEGMPLLIENKLPYNPLKDPELMKRSIDLDGCVQFSHTMEEQIGGQLKAGFLLTHLYEDRDKEGILRNYAPQYIATRAVKPA
jgi:SAM-dependent methyltransferase